MESTGDKYQNDFQGILNFVYDTLNIQITSFDQLSTGSIFSQIIDRLNPMHVHVSVLNWHCLNKEDFYWNYSILKDALEMNYIPLEINYDKLYSLDFKEIYASITFLKNYFLSICSKYPRKSHYDPLRRRGFAEFIYVRPKDRLNCEIRREGRIVSSKGIRGCSHLQSKGNAYEKYTMIYYDPFSFDSYLFNFPLELRQVKNKKVNLTEEASFKEYLRKIKEGYRNEIRYYLRKKYLRFNSISEEYGVVKLTGLKK